MKILCMVVWGGFRAGLGWFTVGIAGFGLRVDSKFALGLRWLVRAGVPDGAWKIERGTKLKSVKFIQSD